MGGGGRGPLSQWSSFRWSVSKVGAVSRAFLLELFQKATTTAPSGGRVDISILEGGALLSAVGIG